MTAILPPRATSSHQQACTILYSQPEQKARMKVTTQLESLRYASAGSNMTIVERKINKNDEERCFVYVKLNTRRVK